MSARIAEGAVRRPAAAVRMSPGVARLLIIAGLIIFWEVSVRLWGDPLFLAPPSQVVVSLYEFIWNPQVLNALRTTLYELVVAFALAVAIGLPLGLILGLQRFAYGSFYPIVLLLYATPQATILPLVILAFGIGTESKIAFGFTHSIFPIVVNVVAGVQGLKPSLIVAARSMGANRRQILTNVVIPHMIPSFFTGMRIGMTGDLLGVLLAELYVSQAGVGHYTRLFTESFEPQRLFALIACLAAIAVFLNESCRRAERRMSRWHD
ncbi:MAG TPA: ABC transporter permease [Stellaceae bacterium]|nr:ABC transporter permease [Stellaceae bacterium]